VPAHLDALGARRTVDPCGSVMPLPGHARSAARVARRRVDQKTERVERLNLQAPGVRAAARSVNVRHEQPTFGLAEAQTHRWTVRIGLIVKTFGKTAGGMWRTFAIPVSFFAGCSLWAKIFVAIGIREIFGPS
jgi:hypothetical protein